LKDLGTALAQAQQLEHAAQLWEQAERVINAIQDSYTQARALKDLVAVLAQAQLWVQAERISSTIQNSSQQAEALRDLGTALAQAQLWVQAERISSTIQISFQRTWVMKELGTAMLSAGMFEHFLHIIQRAWRQVETREEALTLFSIANAFISSKPQIGIPFFDAFTWVDTFLSGED
jgi:hypothetical protein